MFSIPSWAIGVVAIMAGIGLVQILVRVATKALGLPPTWGQSRGRAVTGMTLPGADSGEHTATLDDLQRRLAELEERLDFAERLLAQQKDAAQLNPPNR
jgi:hypothetical protein